MKHGYWVQGLFTIIAVSACTVDSASTPAAPPIARFVASPQSTSELGVSTWEVRNDGTNDHVIGLDASSERQIEFVVRRDSVTPDERVRLETEEGAFDLTKAGAIENATSDAARRLGVDVHADVGPNGTQIMDDLGSTSSAVSVADPRVSDQGVIQVGFDFFTHQVMAVVSGPCRGGTIRDHGEIYADFGSSGTFVGFTDPTQLTNCSAKFSMTVAGSHSDTFHWTVFDKPTNLALLKNAFQSSTLNGANASRANDGNTDGVFSDNSVSHTNFEFRPWWQVDLGSVKSIGGVVVFNRTDCCSDRLSDFDIFASVDGSTWQWAAGFSGSLTGVSAELDMSAVQGRFVAVQLRGTNYLSLAEVQVFAP
jgi:F5/8 type C domain